MTMAPEAPAKPLPQVGPDMQPFFDAARRRELVVQQCGRCQTLRFPARSICSTCLARDARWIPVSGRGQVFSFAVMHQAVHPGFAAEVPYAVVVIQLDEGPRLLSNLVDCAPGDIRIGMPVEVIFDDVTAEVTLPKFRPGRAGNQPAVST
jgi:uncharacterized OB-fold protein